MGDLTLNISDSAAGRIAKLLASEPAGSRLRVAVMGGGCSGFQYTFDFDSKPLSAEDRLFTKNGAEIVVDEPSLNLLNGGILDYVETLGAAAFEIKNPNATASCGCGNSFAV